MAGPCAHTLAAREAGRVATWGFQPQLWEMDFSSKGEMEGGWDDSWTGRPWCLPSPRSTRVGSQWNPREQQHCTELHAEVRKGSMVSE